MKIARFQIYIFEKAPTVTEDLVPDETKFQVFQVGWIILNCTLLYTEEIQVFMDSLFQSFNQQVSMHNFAELSGCVFSWIEEQCKPGDLQVPKREKLLFLTMSSFQGPDLLNTETDREQRRREKSKPSGSGLPVVQIERIASAQKTRYDSNNRQETLKRIDIFICIH